MQEQLARDPYEALGVVPSSPPEDVRRAFLALTKTYHPAKFARLAADVQKLANEVFLALRAAHDQLSRPVVSSGAHPSTRRSGPIPVARPSAAPQTAPHRASGAIPTERTTGAYPPLARPGSGPHAAPASSTRPTGANPALTVPPAAPTQPAPRASTAPIGSRPAAGQRFVSPASVTTRPMGSGAGTSPPPDAQARRTPTGSMPAVSRTSTSPLAHTSRAPGPASTPPPSPRLTPAVGTPVGARATTQDRELAPILELLTQGQFAASRIALETLATRSPEVPRYRALISYAKGREAQLARRIDEARVELQEALQIDPSLELAKTALAELFTRRR